MPTSAVPYAALSGTSSRCVPTRSPLQIGKACSEPTLRCCRLEEELHKLTSPIQRDSRQEKEQAKEEQQQKEEEQQEREQHHYPTTSSQNLRPSCLGLAAGMGATRSRPRGQPAAGNVKPSGRSKARIERRRMQTPRPQSPRLLPLEV